MLDLTEICYQCLSACGTLTIQQLIALHQSDVAAIGVQEGRGRGEETAPI